MPLELVTIPCRTDNYAFLLHNGASGETALIDAPEAEPVTAELSRRGWELTDLLITHHHGDHVDAVEDLRNGGVRVIGGRDDEGRLPPLDLAVGEGDTFTVCGEEVHVLDVSGHTVGHIAFHFPASKIVFTADSLMALGCGRLFEGTPAQMWESLQKLRALPPETTVCSGHEYTATNARFAMTIEPRNAALISRVRAVDDARAASQPTVPSTLKEEIETNPFLRADQPDLKAAIDMESAPDVEVFAEIRARKDRF
ncbi:hydroxyacylglutathione hydrolase [Pelagovum pacificum]|uniref:Hydroxyacylglutathione hydrolase n=1 Tax=Pelagovum pacificum TaxID=2588711 RepID=A0A5C5G9A8_9RHOB|nr:hydroxyacylglutathione hydrolase [Pelagovum pacificum]QQA42075.1 hydroxyacylglutathione hydrolase [Pelagovum pacificum]TNY31163.1 hydroxyacylglutathione hydrolase [Pelagovum pacificum]